MLTIKNLNDKAANGDASSTITFPDMKAEDQRRIKKTGKKLIIKKISIFDTFLSIQNKAFHKHVF